MKDDDRVLGSEEVLEMLRKLMAETCATIRDCLNEIDERHAKSKQALRVKPLIDHRLVSIHHNADRLEKALYGLARRLSPVSTGHSRPVTYHTGIETWSPERPTTRRLGHMG